MQLELMEKQLKALADQNRLKILSCLKGGEICVCEFVDVLKISQPAVSQHLRKLKASGIILERKEGTWKHYRLADSQSPIVQGVIDELDAVSVCNCKSMGDGLCSS